MHRNMNTIDTQSLLVSALIECHYQGVLVSVKSASFELVLNMRHSHSVTQGFPDDGTQ